ncbi:hypothetical protein ACQPZG_20185 [Streptomyces sp. CA-294286]|uniref:hypothetical protein n=1 Tax=Streptomyces sp. CA-294286 TaxID=3240070 RepID=UPI003D8A6114
MNDTMLLPRTETRALAGYWVQVNGYRAATGVQLQGYQLGGYATPTEARAVAQLRIRVRRVAWRMEGLAAQRAAFEWLTNRWAMSQILASLADEQMYMHLVTDGDVTYEFSARPVYLPGQEQDRTPCDVVPIRTGATP